MTGVNPPCNFPNGYAHARWACEQRLLKRDEDYFGPKGKGDVVHNMSCPPRTCIAVRPLRVQERPRTGYQSGHAMACASGLQLVTRVSVDHLFREWFPAFRSSNKNTDVAYWANRKRPASRAPDTVNLRLRCLVVLSRLAIGDISGVTHRLVHALAGVSTESLETAYIENTARLDPRVYGLPAFGLVQPGGGHDSMAMSFDLEPTRALAVLSRTAGTVFSAARTPVVPDHAHYIPPVALFACIPAGGEATNG